MRIYNSVLILATAIACVLYVDLSRDEFRRKVNREIHLVSSDAGQRLVEPSPEAAYEGLPEPVQRYFRFGIGKSHAPIRTVRVSTKGERKSGNNWVPFESEQVYSLVHPSFATHTVAEPSRFVWIESRHSYHRGAAFRVEKLYSALTLSTDSGKQADVSALERFLVDAPWYPTALLPGGYVQWQEVDAGRARAVIRDGSYTASAVFSFNGKGEIAEIIPDQHPWGSRSSEGRGWSLHLGNYTEIDGIRVPTSVEVRLDEDTGMAVHRVTVTGIHYYTGNDAVDRG